MTERSAMARSSSRMGSEVERARRNPITQWKLMFSLCLSSTLYYKVHMFPAMSRPASILHPVVDFLCAGGLSILVIVPLLISGREDLSFLAIGAIVWAQYLLNYSHFMASYR